MLDLHLHTLHSDGSCSAEQVVDMARRAGLELCAVTDHDCVDGVGRAIARGKEQGIWVVSGLEMNIQHSCTLHVLAYAFDYHNPALLSLLERQEERRRQRNEEMLRLLERQGMDLQIERPQGEGEQISRAHIAAALVRGGWAKDRREAFDRFIGEEGSAYVPLKSPEFEEYARIIHDAGGVCALAHPCQLRCESEPLVRRMKEQGLWGIEAHYPANTPEQTREYCAWAKKYGLYQTCGSDFHGSLRAGIQVGMLKEEAYLYPELRQTLNFLKCRAEN